MSDTNWDFVARKPRHVAEVDEKLLVKVRELFSDPASQGHAMASGHISDLSRDGAQLFVQSPLPKDAALILQLWHENELLAELTAKLHWTTRDSANQWRCGISFDKPLSHELLGELLLRELLTH